MLKKKNFLRIAVLLITISLVLVNCNEDNQLELQQNDSFQENKFVVKTVNASEIPEVINFITNKVSKDLKIQLDDSLRKDIIHTKSTEDDIIVGEIITSSVKTVTDESQKTNYSFKITKEDLTASYFLNLIIKETDTESYAYIVKYEYDNTVWEYLDNNFNTYKGKKIFYSPTGSYLASYDIDNGIITNKVFGSPCDDDSGNGSSSTGDGSSTNGNDLGGNGTPLDNGNSDTGDDNDSGSDSNNTGGGGTQTNGVLGPCDQQYVLYFAATDGNGNPFLDADGNPVEVQVTVDCNGVAILSKNSQLGYLLKNGDIDSNGDCIPDYLDDGYDGNTDDDDDDENDFEPINVNLGLISQLFALTGQALTPEGNLWVSDPDNSTQVDNIFNYLEANPNSQNAIDLVLLLIEISTEGIRIDFEIIEDYPCQSKIILDAIINTSNFSSEITNIFTNVDNGYDLSFNYDENLHFPTTGATDWTSSQSEWNMNMLEVNIDLSIDLMNSSDLGIAMTVIHESMHAMILYLVESGQITSTNPNGNLSDFASEYANALAMNDIALGLVDISLLGDLQHEYMAEIVNQLTSAITTFGESKGYNLTPLYYEALVWKGLSNTNEFLNIINDADEGDQEAVDLIDMIIIVVDNELHNINNNANGSICD